MAPKDTNQELTKKILQHQEQQIVKHVGEFLVFLEEGTTAQIEQAKNQGKSALLKHGPEMQKLAEVIGAGFPEKVEQFLHQVDIILHSAPGWIDDSKIFEYYNSAYQLETKLRKAA